MGKINWTRVILGGLVAGLIINVFEWLLNGVIIAKDMEAAMNIASVLPPICLPSARITRVQLIFPMIASSNEICSNSTPDTRPAKGPVSACHAVCRELKSVFLDGFLLDAANLLFGLEPVVEF